MTDHERTELAELLSENQLLTHMLVTCGVIADHPDATLGDRHPYSTEWNSQQSERVRGLRRKHDALRGATARLCRAISRRMQADEPTPEDRIELMEAYDAASAFLANAAHQPAVNQTPTT